MQKRSIRDSLKEWKQQQAAEPKPEAKPAEKQPAKPAPAQQKKRSAPPIVAYETVQASCGHDIQFGLFEDRLDKFRKERRIKWQQKPCPACKILQREQREAEQKLKREQKGLPGQGKWKHGRLVDRLPHDSVFHVTYNAEAERWSGTLTVPGREPFVNDSSGLFKLLPKLDAMYRQWVAEQLALTQTSPVE